MSKVNLTRENWANGGMDTWGLFDESVNLEGVHSIGQLPPPQPPAKAKEVLEPTEESNSEFVTPLQEAKRLTRLPTYERFRFGDKAPVTAAPPSKNQFFTLSESHDDPFDLLEPQHFQVMDTLPDKVPEQESPVEAEAPVEVSEAKPAEVIAEVIAEEPAFTDQQTQVEEDPQKTHQITLSDETNQFEFEAYSPVPEEEVSLESPVQTKLQEPLLNEDSEEVPDDSEEEWEELDFVQLVAILTVELPGKESEIALATMDYLQSQELMGQSGGFGPPSLFDDHDFSVGFPPEPIWTLEWEHEVPADTATNQSSAATSTFQSAKRMAELAKKKFYTAHSGKTDRFVESLLDARQNQTLDSGQQENLAQTAQEEAHKTNQLVEALLESQTELAQPEVDSDAVQHELEAEAKKTDQLFESIVQQNQLEKQANQADSALEQVSSKPDTANQRVESLFDLAQASARHATDDADSQAADVQQDDPTDQLVDSLLETYGAEQAEPSQAFGREMPAEHKPVSTEHDSSVAEQSIEPKAEGIPSTVVDEVVTTASEEDAANRMVDDLVESLLEGKFDRTPDQASNQLPNQAASQAKRVSTIHKPQTATRADELVESLLATGAPQTPAKVPPAPSEGSAYATANQKAEQLFEAMQKAQLADDAAGRAQDETLKEAREREINRADQLVEQLLDAGSTAGQDSTAVQAVQVGEPAISDQDMEQRVQTVFQAKAATTVNQLEDQEAKLAQPSPLLEFEIFSSPFSTNGAMDQVEAGKGQTWELFEPTAPETVRRSTYRGMGFQSIAESQPLTTEEWELFEASGQPTALGTSMELPEHSPAWGSEVTGTANSATTLDTTTSFQMPEPPPGIYLKTAAMAAKLLDGDHPFQTRSQAGAQGLPEPAWELFTDQCPPPFQRRFWVMPQGQGEQWDLYSSPPASKATLTVERPINQVPLDAPKPLEPTQPVFDSSQHAFYRDLAAHTPVWKCELWELFTEQLPAPFVRAKAWVVERSGTSWGLFTPARVDGLADVAEPGLDRYTLEETTTGVQRSLASLLNQQNQLALQLSKLAANLNNQALNRLCEQLQVSQEQLVGCIEYELQRQEMEQEAFIPQSMLLFEAGNAGLMGIPMQRVHEVLDVSQAFGQHGNEPTWVIVQNKIIPLIIPEHYLPHQNKDQASRPHTHVICCQHLDTLIGVAATKIHYVLPATTTDSQSTASDPFTPFNLDSLLQLGTLNY